MKALSAFYDYLLPELPGCTTALLDLHMVEVARQICEDTALWRADFDAVDTVADQATYALEPSEPQSVVAKVIRVTVDEVVLWDSEWQQNCGRDEPRYHLDAPFSINADFTEITFIEDETPGEAVTDGLAIYGALKPKFGATQLPDMLLTTYLEAFRKVVMARLMLMPKKPWSNPELAMEYRNEADSLMTRAATENQRGNVGGPLRVRKNPF